MPTTPSAICVLAETPPVPILPAVTAPDAISPAVTALAEISAVPTMESDNWLFDVTGTFVKLAPEPL